MTHPIVEAVAETLTTMRHNAYNNMSDEKRAQHLVAEVLRLAREPSEMMDTAMYRQCVEGLRGTPDEVWRAGIDALRREVEAG